MREALSAEKADPRGHGATNHAELLIVALGDRILDLVSREKPTPDPTIGQLGRNALAAYAREALG